MRKHSEDHTKCWCRKKYPVVVEGKIVGEAVPLETGNYSVTINNDPTGRKLRKLISQGMLRSFSIQDFDEYQLEDENG